METMCALTVDIDPMISNCLYAAAPISVRRTSTCRTSKGKIYKSRMAARYGHKDILISSSDGRIFSKSGSSLSDNILVDWVFTPVVPISFISVNCLVTATGVTFES